MVETSDLVFSLMGIPVVLGLMIYGDMTNLLIIIAIVCRRLDTGEVEFGLVFLWRLADITSHVRVCANGYGHTT